MNSPDPDDPKGLIREAYAIEGIGDAECRSILVDWALSLPQGADAPAALARVLARRGPGAADHPMTLLMAEGVAPEPLVAPGATRRRGGQAGRRSLAR
jgi:hypothetical protein